MITLELLCTETDTRRLLVNDGNENDDRDDHGNDSDDFDDDHGKDNVNTGAALH